MALKADLKPSDFLDTQLTFDIESGNKVLMNSSTIGVAQIVGDIEKGMKRFGLTAGQFSLSDLIEYILNKIGPSDLYLSTWAASSEGLKKTFAFLESKMIRNVKFMIDTGAKQYRDRQFGELIDRFGDCLRTTRIHAKFVVIRNENYSIVIRTSANLNRNTRLETFEIDECEKFADFFQAFFNEAFKSIAVNENHKLASSKKLAGIVDNMIKKEPKKDSLKLDYDFG